MAHPKRSNYDALHLVYAFQFVPLEVSFIDFHSMQPYDGPYNLPFMPPCNYHLLFYKQQLMPPLLTWHVHVPKAPCDSP